MAVKQRASLLAFLLVLVASSVIAGRVKLQVFETGGSTGQCWVRDTSSADGGAWGSCGSGGASASAAGSLCFGSMVPYQGAAFQNTDYVTIGYQGFGTTTYSGLTLSTTHAGVGRLRNEFQTLSSSNDVKGIYTSQNFAGAYGPLRGRLINMGLKTVTSGAGWGAGAATFAAGFPNSDSAVNALTNIAAILCRSTDTNAQACANDGSGSIACTDLGSSYPCHTSGVYYDIEVTYDAGAFTYHLGRIDSPNDTSGSFPTSSGVPDMTAIPTIGGLRLGAWAHTEGTSSPQTFTLTGLEFCHGANQAEWEQ